MSGVAWRFRAGIDAEALRPDLARIVADLEAGRLVNRKSGRRKELYEVEGHLLKVNRYHGLRAWRSRVRGSKARREFQIAHAIHERGLRTPLPSAWGEHRVRGRVTACFLLVPRLADARDLEQVARDPGLSSARRRALARAFGSFTRRSHEAGVLQDDLAPNNFLLSASPEPELLMIDCERVRLRSGPLPFRTRRRLLSKLGRRLPQATLAEQHRFLLGYARDAEDSRTWWWALGEYAPALARRDLARVRRAAFRDGRLVQRVREADRAGFARRGASLEREAWRLPLPSDSREVWAVAILLARRGLVPDPLAWLRTGSQACLLLVREPGSVRLSDAAASSQHRVAIERLLRSLLALGSFCDPPGPSDIVLGPGAARLLSVRGFRVGSALPRSQRFRAARDLARGLWLP